MPPGRRPSRSSRSVNNEALRLIENLLRPSLGSRRSPQVAMRLLEKFGSVGAVLSAPARRLVETHGVGEATARHLTEIFHAACYVAAEQVETDKPILASSSALLSYCRLQMAFLPVEQLRVLYLDKRNRLIADEVQQSGTVDHTPVYPREIIHRCLDLSATGLILVHNHPSGDPTPSPADFRMTKEIDEAAKVFDILLHDHWIIGRFAQVRLKGLM